ncbi:MAG: hypothetical protein A2X81_09935 [Desulfobacterales bacterium GWB2_56_26]|nr:MAG: hypothetical protein A2X81_09935 [Desulfobacterales bacterium GWB2_56_26]
MNFKNKQIRPPEQAGIEVSLERLRGRQSVRTTFRLPEGVIVLLGMAAGQFGLQQKALLDQLIDNAEFMQLPDDEGGKDLQEKQPVRPKTFVLSKRSLYILEKVSRERRIPRDALVAAVIQQLMPIIRAEREKQRKRQEIYADMVTYLRYGQNLLAKTENSLGKDDQILEMMARMVRLGEEGVAKMAEIIDRGRNMEEVAVDILK